MKICTVCYIEKNLTDFNKHKDSIDGHRGQCRECQSKYQKNYKINNKEKVSIYNKKYKEDNPDIYQKWVEKNRDKVKIIKDRYELKMKNDPIFKVSRMVRNSIRTSFRHLSFKKNTKTNQILGCSTEEFIIYIESTFSEGMSISNHGEWHLDHIIPISQANTYEDAIKLNHFTNFQALWAEDNLKKGKKYEPIN